MALLAKKSIFTKIFSLFLLIIILSLVSHMLVAHRVQNQFLQKQAKSIARQIVLTRQWIAGLGGVWSKDSYSDSHGFLTDYKEASSVEDAAVFYLHNPALATREISSLADIKYGYTFTVVSDLYREPKNKPDNFEANALKMIQSDGRKYFDESRQGLYRYTEPLYVKKGCLKCHGDLNSDVKEPMKSILLDKYGDRAFGYKEGDVRGIISIKIPTESLWSVLGSIFNYWNYLILAVSVLLLYLFARFIIIMPIKSLTQSALQLSKGKMDVEFGVANMHENSKDEITQLAVAFERMRRSFQIVMTQFAKLKQKTRASTKK